VREKKWKMMFRETRNHDGSIGTIMLGIHVENNHQGNIDITSTAIYETNNESFLDGKMEMENVSC
jgi:hypothetical protein